ncbi:Nucleoside-diphosphatase mig-23 [Trichinella pseudospiralis]|uniref:Nucleoside-diphosphatase mig-23 n=2 Tax=Trichinella pseudospiralis TaxID=6337 RepID=A0A0V1HHP1_TRIPS|nr:Nucleoside-diphosphatase mig-23 [Trichinella pseudospiralis]KRY65501.1 Nucleoside-diphosphatase mig-23 [Trichinella pseudospiralis]KRZ09948.1 Nucleoside-diphosphatase mig-23 [Trichinella pseudospiralis]KRZ43024.1 Nucleoside-diphosphatase mig-23 [Trichinella pseudospiralis]KRZ43025.1 Nucleoside-diphosphatase mig-23 [Trichinella pseudospiralis]
MVYLKTEMRWNFRRISPIILLFSICFLLYSCSVLLQKKSQIVLPRFNELLDQDVVHYVMVVDAGSSGSRLFLYWCDLSGHSSDELMRVEPLLDEFGRPIVKKKNPGLSSFAKKPKDAVKYMKDLIDSSVKHIPVDRIKQTSLFVLATAGMRLLPAEESNAIIEELRSTLPKLYDFVVSSENLEVINGRWEGIYAWITINYVLGRFNCNKTVSNLDMTVQKKTCRSSTAGIVDLGGASLQIAYEVKEPTQNTTTNLHSELYEELNLGNDDASVSHKYTVFANTYLGYGANVGIERYKKWLANSSTILHKDPIKNSTLLSDCCLPNGLIEQMSTDKAEGRSEDLIRQGRGCFNECYDAVSRMIQSNVTCSTSHQNEQCFLEGIPLPALDSSNAEFYGISEYWHSTNDIFGLGGRYDMHRLKNAASEFCSLNWTTIWNRYRRKQYLNADTSRIRTQCFKSAWASALLHIGLKFPEDVSNFYSVLTMAGQEIQWTLGAILYRLRHLPLKFAEMRKQYRRLSFLAEKKYPREIYIVNGNFLLYFLFIVVAVLAVLYIVNLLVSYFLPERRVKLLTLLLRRKVPLINYIMTDNSSQLPHYRRTI